MAQSLHGVLLVDKPRGISSFAVLSKIQKSMALPRNLLPKFGHGGTLDPFATGLLMVCVGEATKLSRYFLQSQKTYEAALQFGEHTASGDCTDPILKKTQILPDSLDEIQAAAKTFEKEPYWQIPPMHSALKKEGKPLYELARQGIEIERAPRESHLENFCVLDYQKPVARFQVSCSAGTYIRVLAQDLAQKLGTLGHLTELRRLGSGKFSIQNALPLPFLCETPPENWPQLHAWVAFDKILTDTFPSLTLDAQEALWVEQGKTRFIQDLQTRLFSLGFSSPVQLLCNGNLIAIATATTGIERVFPPRLR